MRLRLLFMLLILAAPLLAQMPAKSIQHRFLVKWNPAASKAFIGKTFRTPGSVQYLPLYPAGAPGDRSARTEPAPAYSLIVVDTTAASGAMLAYFHETGFFEYVEVDAIGSAAAVAGPAVFPNDPGFSKQWALHNDGSFSPSAKSNADINMPEAWSVQQGSDKITVAILDTGLKTDHPEFKDRLWSNPKEIPENGLDDDNNGYTDDAIGWNFTNSSRIVTDDAGHGTHVASIVAARGNNAANYAGVDWNCKIMICKVLAQDNTGYYSWWAQAIHYAVDHGAKVINMSLGGDVRSQTLEDAVNYARSRNVLIVASMQNANNNVTYYPAGYGATLAVGATDPDDNRSTRLGGTGAGSNYGNHIDLVAPGNYIYGLSPGINPNDAVVLSGTSQAAPFVSGVAALLWAQQPNATVAEIEKRITASADDQVGNPTEDAPGWDLYYGYGRLNAFRALVNDLDPSQQTENTVALFPNPTSDETTLSIILQEPSPVTIALTDSRGNAITQITSEESRIFEHPLHTANLPNGLYLISVRARNHRWSGKLIVLH